jgi:dUTPase
MKFYKSHPQARTPTRTNSTDSGWDFYGLEDTIVRPGEIVRIPTGIVIGCDPNCPGFIFDKSGRGAAGLKVLGGVIDQTYVGEIQIILGNINLFNILQLLGGHEQDVHATLQEFRDALKASTIIIERYKAIAQMVFQPIYDVVTIDEVSQSEFEELYKPYYEGRGSKGFGSSDTK